METVEETIRETIRIRTFVDSDITYFSPLQRVGPLTWAGLRSSYYSVSPKDAQVTVQQQTFPQAARLLAFGLSNKDGEFSSEVAPVIEAVHRYTLTGNTLTLWTPQGLYGVDFPEDDIVGQLNVDEQPALLGIQANLDKRLKGVTGDKVRASSDGCVRFASHDALTENSNSGLITLVGDEATAKALGELASRYYKRGYGFYGLGKQNKLTLKVPVFDSYGFDSGLNVGGSWVAGSGNRCSFGGAKNFRGAK